MDFDDVTFTHCLYWMAIFLVSFKGCQYIGNARKRRGDCGNALEATYTHQRLKPIPTAPSVPLLGSIPFLGNYPAETIAKWYRGGKLGSIFRVKFGPLDAVLLNDYDSIRDCFVRRGNCVSGRDQNAMVELWKGDGILFLDYGMKYKSQHKFCHHAFRHIFRKDKLHQMGLEEGREMANALKMQLRNEYVAEGYCCGNYRKATTNCRKNKCNCISIEADSDWKCLDPNIFAYQFSENIVCRILFGRSFHRDEKEYCDILTGKYYNAGHR